MNVPKLRFRDNDGQEFPSWHAKKIGDFVTSHKGGAPLKPSDFIKEGSFEVIPKKAISSGGYLFLDKAEPTYCTAEFFENNQRSVVDKNYLITTLRDLVPSGPSIGYIVKFNNDNKYILAQGVYGIKISDDLLGDFLIQYSNTDNYRVLMQTMMVGSTQVHIRNSDFFQTPFCVPCLKEQTKIANFLSAVDEKISLLKQKSDLLAQYKKGVMQKIFSQELRFKDDDGQEFPEWTFVALADISTKKSSNISANSLDENEGEFKIYGAAGVLKKINFYTQEEPYISVVKDGAGVGRTFYCEAKTSVLGTLEIIQPSRGVDSRFLHNVMLQIDFAAYITGSTIPHVYYKDYSKETVPLPCNKEQTKIANFLTAIDDKITQTQAELDAVKQYKQGLLQQMFV